MLRSLLFLLCASACTSGICGPSELTSALAAARPGDVVTIGSCEIAGAFTVPAGVSLVGSGPSSVLASVDGAAPVLEIAAGQNTRVSTLSIAVDHGGFGLHATGAGTLRLEALTVRVTRGVGIGLRDRTVTIDALSLSGPITMATAPTAPSTQADTGTFGLVARSAQLTMSSVHAQGFAVGAIALVDGSLTWTDIDSTVDIEQTRGVGLGLFGTDAAVVGVELGNMLSGIGYPGVSLAAGMGTGPSQLHANTLTIAEGPGYGIFGDQSALDLRHVTVQHLGLVGIQAQGGSVTATDLTLVDNGGAGLVALDSLSVSITSATITDQRTVLLPSDSGDAMIGDGIDVRRVDTTSPAIDLSISDTSLERNARTGLLIDAAGTTPARLDLMRVMASSDAAGALGVTAQRTTLPSGWDSGVTRSGVTAADDAAFSGMIDPVGLIMPPTLVALPPSF